RQGRHGSSSAAGPTELGAEPKSRRPTASRKEPARAPPPRANTRGVQAFRFAWLDVDARQFGRRVDQLKAVDEQLNLTTARGDVGLANTIATARRIVASTTKAMSFPSSMSLLSPAALSSSSSSAP